MMPSLPHSRSLRANGLGRVSNVESNRFVASAPLGGFAFILQLFQRGRSQSSKAFHKVIDLMDEFGSFGRGYPPASQPVLLDAAEIQQLFQKLHTLLGRIITVQVMAVSKASPTHKHAIHAFLKSAQNMVRRDSARAHHSNHPNIGRVLQSTNPSQVSSGVCSPGTQKAQDRGLEPVIAHALDPFYSE